MTTEAEKARHINDLEEELARAESELYQQWVIWSGATLVQRPGYLRVAIDAKLKADKWEKKADELRGRIVALKHPHS